MPFTIAPSTIAAVTVGIVVGLGLVTWGVTLRVRNPEAARHHDVELTGNPAVDLSLMAAIPTSSGIAQMLVGIVVLVTTLATLVVA